MIEARLGCILSRAIALVAGETLSLQSGAPADETGFAGRKSMILFELLKLEGAFAAVPPDAETVAQLNQLRRLLGENRAALATHIAAANAIAAMFADSRRAADSDGTYSVSMASRRRGP
jgi:hypothetical protein